MDSFPCMAHVYRKELCAMYVSPAQVFSFQAKFSVSAPYMWVFQPSSPPTQHMAVDKYLFSYLNYYLYQTSSFCWFDDAMTCSTMLCLTM